jgi:eukaryotic-like serine/threonine-protein kinase
MFEPLPEVVELGPFRLDRRVGKGGMASVYGGIHVASSLPVAVKVLDPRRARDPVFQRCFDTEVQAFAALDHPGIVLVFDYGTISESAARSSHGKLAEGSAWLAMELASGGSLAQQQLPLKWGTCKAILLALLDSLAHAHARGVIHRDIKRGNVLLSTEGDARPGPKLTDFGLAHLPAAGVPEGSAFAGTPNYMSPEQCDGRWRDYGPWTDLYALGCLAWALVSGGPPFVARSVAQIVNAHRESEPPPLLARTPVPDGLEDWLRRLLEKAPTARYDCAADAARALLRLPEAKDGPTHPPADGWEEAGTRPWTLSSLQVGDGEPGTQSSPPSRPPETFAPVPTGWRRPAAEPPSPRLQGAGLGLWGLRDRPVVGREPLRDRLWGALRGVAQARSARLVVLRGEAGLGTGRVARWLGRRAEELGAAQVVEVDMERGPAEVVVQGLRVEGLGRTACRRRVSEQLAVRGEESSEEVDVVTELVLPGAPERPSLGPGEHRFASAAERYEAVARHLDRTVSARAVVVLADGAGVGVAEFLRHLIDRQPHRPSPWLLIVTAPSDVEIPPPLQGVAALELELGPLDGSALRELISSQLELAPAITDALVERSAGNPMFALSLLGDWIDRDLLRLDRGGFILTERPDLPDDLHGLWQRRIDALVASAPDGTDEALELAALLGPRVVEEPWRRACEERGVVWTAAAVRRMVHAGLLLPDGDGWRLAHPLLEESLLRSARDAGRLPRAHLACSQALVDETAPPVVARRAEHLAAAGRTAAAATAWRTAAKRGSEALGLDRCVQWLEAADEVDPALDGEGRVSGGLLRAQLLLAAGRIDDAVTAVSELGGHPLAGRPVAAQHALLAGVQSLRNQELDPAWVSFDRALALYREDEDVAGEARSLRYLARTLAVQGRLDGARAHARSGLAAAQRSGLPILEAEVLAVLGGIERRAGRFDVSSELCARAADIAEAHGRTLLGAEALLLAGESLRAAGDLVAAGAAYRAARARWRRSGSRYALVAELNLAMLDVHRRAWDEAALRLETAGKEAEALGDAYITRAARMLLLPCLAARGHWKALEVSLIAAEADARGLMAETDTAEAAELAGVMAAADGPRDLAGRAWWLAWRVWGELDRPERQSILEEALAGAGLPIPKRALAPDGSVD